MKYGILKLGISLSTKKLILIHMCVEAGSLWYAPHLLTTTLLYFKYLDEIYH